MQSSNKNFIPDGWKFIEFDKIVNLSKEKYNPNPNEHLKCLELEHFEKEKGFTNGYVDSAEQSSTKNVFNIGDVLFGKLRPYLKKYTKAKFNGVCSTEIWVFNEKKIVSINNYIFLIIQTERFNYIANVSSGTHMPRADWSYVSSFPFLLPPLGEQEGIAGVLGDWDSALELLDKQIELKTQQKNYLMQVLLTGTLRLHSFTSPWNEVKLGDVITERVETSNINNQYDVLTSSRRGIYLQEEYFKKQVASEDNTGYKIIHKNDFTYRAMTDDDKFVFNVLDKFNIGIISPAYSVFYTDKIPLILLKEYMNSKFFGNELNKISQGGTRKTLKFTNLKKLKINIPTDITEQKAIADVLTAADEEIKLLKQKRTLIAQQKKYLMQTLLTGQIRIPIKKDN